MGVSLFELGAKRKRFEKSVEDTSTESFSDTSPITSACKLDFSVSSEYSLILIKVSFDALRTGGSYYLLIDVYVKDAGGNKVATVGWWMIAPDTTTTYTGKALVSLPAGDYTVEIYCTCSSGTSGEISNKKIEVVGEEI